MQLAAATMPHVYDKAGQELSSQHYIDLLKQSEKENARRTNQNGATIAGDLADTIGRVAETRKGSTSSGANPKYKKRMRKSSSVLPKLVEHLQIRDRSGSVPVMFPPLPASSSQLWEEADTLSLRDKVPTPAADPRKEKVKVKGKVKLPMPPKFALYRKLGAKGGENFYKAPEKLMEGRHGGGSGERKRPGHSVTQEKRRAGLMQALSSNYDNFNFPRVIQATGEDPATIKKKIEQFRRWHEEQYKEKLAKLTDEVDGENIQKKKDKNKMFKWNSMDELDRADKIKNISIEFTSREPTANTMLPYITIPNDPIKLGKVLPDGKKRSPSPPAPIPDELLQRPPSTLSWHTWRGVNESDAYDNVQEYIKENELMSDEKRKHIQSWVDDVERNRSEKTPDSLLHLTDAVIPEERAT